MAASGSPARSRFQQYHEIAADVLRVKRPSTAVSQLLEAAESGNVSVCEKLITQYRGIVDMRCEETGDTPLIAAARCQQTQVIDLLLNHSADCTLQNDNGESVLEVSTPKLKKHILKSLSRGSSDPTTARDLLHAAWLGDAVSVTKSLSGDKRIDVNCRNTDGLTPLLLVTRDTGVFEQVQHAMRTEYDPVKVMDQLLKNNSNVKATDREGKSALHLVANNKNVQAKKMVSLLLERGADLDCKDEEQYAPLHIASKLGHTAIVVALVEGNANINLRGGEKGDTPLMLSASGGHKETTQYLISMGADIKMKDSDGNDAMTLAKTSSLTAMIEDAWVNEQTSSTNEGVTPSTEYMLPVENTDGLTPMSDTGISSFFVTERRTSVDSEERLNNSDSIEEPDCSTPDLIDADDEQEDGIYGSNKRSKPGTKRNQLRQTMEETVARRNQLMKERPILATPPTNYSRGRSRTCGETTLSTKYSNQKSANDQKKKTSIQERLLRTKSKHLLEKSGTLSKSLESLNTNESRKVTPPSSLITFHHTSQTSVPPPPSEQHTKRASLPALHRTPSKDKPSKLKNSISTSSIDRLPNILSSTNMKPIAMVCVDAETENLRVQNLNKKSPLKKQQPSTKDNRPMSRSNSLQSIRQSPTPSLYQTKKRNSADYEIDRAHGDSRMPFLPAVVSPQLSSTAAGTNPNPFPSSFGSRNRSYQPQLPHGGHQQHSNRSGIKPTQPSSTIVSGQQLSAVSEASNETSSSSSATSYDNKTLTAPPTIIPTQQQLNIQHDNDMGNKDVAVDYPNDQQPNDEPLSPIWSLARQPLPTDSDTSSEYISSYIGAKTPLQPLLSSIEPVEVRKVGGADSGQGESEDEHRRAQLSSESETEELLPADQGVLKWKRGRVLGKGAFGKVCEGLMDNAKLIAVKEIELDTSNTREKAQIQFDKIQQEVDILRSLSHKNIVQYHGASMDQSMVYIFMEYISGGSLQSILKRFGSLDERTVAHYSRQITRGLDYLHNNGIIHRDIKGANIMVTSKGVVKLIDFGCAKRHCQDLTEGIHSVRGTPFWMSPEVIRGQAYGRKSDIWSLGCTIHEMIMSKPPWGDLPPEAAMFHIGIGESLPPLPDKLSEHTRNIIDICLKRDAQARPTTKELLNHPFLQVAAKQSNSMKRKGKKHSN